MSRRCEARTCGDHDAEGVVSMAVEEHCQREGNVSTMMPEVVPKLCMRKDGKGMPLSSGMIQANTAAGRKFMPRRWARGLTYLSRNVYCDGHQANYHDTTNHDVKVITQ